MKGFVSPAPLTLALAVLIAVGSIVAGVVAISSLAKPANYDERMEAVRQSLDFAENVRTVPGAEAFGARAVCNRPLLAAAGALRGDLAARAETSGLKVTALEVGSETAPGVGDRLAPLNIRFAVEGSYDFAVRLTALMESARPEVFVDSYELRRRGAGVILNMTGRAFCWTSVRR